MSLLRRRECCLAMLIFTTIYTLILVLRPGPASSAAPGAANPVLNIQFLGTYHYSDNASHGLELTGTNIYPASLTLSSSGPDVTAPLASTDFLKELNEHLAGIYRGGKVHLSDNVLLSVDWGRLAVLYSTPDLFKASIYYYLTDPLGENASGFEGEVSYAVGGSVRVGVTATGALSKNSDLENDWKGMAFLSYSFGSQQAIQ